MAINARPQKDDTSHYHLTPLQIRAERRLGAACDWLTLSAICGDCSLIRSVYRFHQAFDDGNKPLPTGKLNWLMELCGGGDIGGAQSHGGWAELSITAAWGAVVDTGRTHTELEALDLCSWGMKTSGCLCSHPAAPLSWCFFFNRAGKSSPEPFRFNQERCSRIATSPAFVLLFQDSFALLHRSTPPAVLSGSLSPP